MKPSKLKVMTILGTRPEIIRLSRTMSLLDELCDHVCVHTGQNYDFELNEVFYRDLALRKPDHYLGVDASSLGRALGNILIETERVLLEAKPEAVLILGDTNSAIAGIMAKRMKIPLYHMEAGNRCFDQNVPEETNRRIVDRIADFNLVYTEHARRHLLSEGFPHRRIYLTGSPLREVLEHYRPGIESSQVLRELDLRPREFLLVSLHREENVDHPGKLAGLVETLDRLAQAFAVPVIVSTHPRTRKRLESLGRPLPERLRFMKPFGFLDYNRLQLDARCVLSDSGSIAEESAILGFPAVTLRTAIERPEALDTGSIVMTGLDPDTIEASVRLVVAEFERGTRPPVPADYTITNCSQRVARLILGTARLSNAWDGIAGGPQP
jgi:UDP-N-acetylglucosamine 2-epimerase